MSNYTENFSGGTFTNTIKSGNNLTLNAATSGSYIAVPILLSSIPVNESINFQTTLPTGTGVSVYTSITNDNITVPTSWISHLTGEVLQDLLFIQNTSGKYLWIKYVLTSPNTTDTPIVNGLQLETYSPSTVEIFLSKTTESWFGVIPIVGLKSGSITDTYARVQLDTGNYNNLVWDSSRNQFTGLLKIGTFDSDNYIGCSYPTGTKNVTLQVSNSSNFSTIDYTSAAKTITLYAVYRRTSKDGLYDNTQFNPTWDGSKWQYKVYNFGVYTLATDGIKNNVTVAVPIHPITANITIKNVQINDTWVANQPNVTPYSIPQGDAYGSGGAWWWDSGKHTLFIRFVNVSPYRDEAGITTNETQVFSIDFESDTDLFATRYDAIKTGNIGLRQFLNGMVLANKYYYTSILGGGTGYYSSAGRQVDTHVRKSGQDVPVVVDCMERIAIHVDDTVLYNNTYDGDYPANLFWKGDWKGFINAESNFEITIKTTSESAIWQQAIMKKISAQRLLSIRSQSRFGKQDYQLTNNDTVAHKFPFVWGKEPWASNDRQTNDCGIYSDSTQSVQVDISRDISTLPKNYMLQYDSKVFCGMGILFPQITSGNAYFVRNAPIYKNVPGATYPIPVSVQTGSSVDSVFFETVFNSVQPGQTVYVSFYQGQYAGSSYSSIYNNIDNDYDSLVPTHTTVTGQTLRILTGAINGYINFDLYQKLYMNSSVNDDLKQQLYSNSLKNVDTKQIIYCNSSLQNDLKQSFYVISSLNSDTKQKIYKNASFYEDMKQILYSNSFANVDSKQILYNHSSTLFDTLQQMFENGVLGYSLFDIRLAFYSNNVVASDTLQKIFKITSSFVDTRQRIYQISSNEFPLAQQIYQIESLDFDTLQSLLDHLSEYKHVIEYIMKIYPNVEINMGVTPVKEFKFKI